MAGQRTLQTLLVKNGDHRVTIAFTAEMDSTIRQIAARRKTRVAPMLRDWIKERLAEEVKKNQH